MNNRNLLPIVPEVGKSKIKMMVDLVSGDEPLLIDDIFYVSLHGGEPVIHPKISFMRALIPFIKVKPLWPFSLPKGLIS